VTLLEVLRRATSYLQTHGSSSPRLDAEVLLGHALGLRRLDLYLQFERDLPEAEVAPFRELVARRATGEPVAYLTGHKEFMGLDFEVTPDVLVPNPDTELLVQTAVGWVREQDGEVRAADVGTGSGCIAVSIAHFCPQVRVWASDASAAALAVARRNIAAHGVGERVELIEGDLLEPLPVDLDLVCANLPYIEEGTALPAEVLAQPRQALYAGPAGAELVERLLTAAPSHMRAGGLVLAEIDPAIQASVAPLAADLYAGHELVPDLGGRVRLLKAWKS
jgi:release factor glutamine methyltransferase